MRPQRTALLTDRQTDGLTDGQTERLHYYLTPIKELLTDATSVLFAVKGD